MSSYASPLPSGKTSPRGFLRVLGKIFTGSGVIETDALLVEAQGSPDMTVKVNGSALDDTAIFKHTDGNFIQAWNETDVNVTIDANASGVTKKDAIVAYVDLADYDASNADNPDSFKFIAVRGSGTDTAPDDTQIRAGTVGATNPYIVLAHVTVANGAVSINSGNISDQRVEAEYIARDLIDQNGNEQIKFSSTASAVNELTVTNAATGNAPSVSATGDDTNINVRLNPKGTGKVTKNGNPIDWWEELGRQDAGSPTDNFTVNLSESRNNLKLLIMVGPQSGNVNLALRFNGDTGNNYSYRREANGAVDTTATSQPELFLSGGASNSIGAEVLIQKVSPTSTVALTGSVIIRPDSSAVAPGKQFVAGYWSGTAAITSITVRNTDTGDFVSASRIIVLGHD